MCKYKIRFACEDDASRLLAIYAPYVENTTVSFEYDVPGEDEFKGRIRGIKKDYPYLVCENEGEIVGYAYAVRTMRRAAYAWNVELSVYLKEECTSRGIGTALYSALFEILRLQNVQNAYACLCSPNPKSERLHRKMGFELAGTWHDTGFKNGSWHDIMWFEKRIGNGEVPPKAFVPVNALDAKALASIFIINEKFIR